MNKNEKMSFLKGKGAAIGIVVCFMAFIFCSMFPYASSALIASTVI